ncbi:CASP-like protein 4A1 [Phragmites australis]|uniref:CASP-like protein 4A1 n=1 Tax=Phragmites australis TaxID=29695 RepID=UPI002D77B3AA|nr:CASP-like protein 4A1 [Phragmites australis]
MAHRSPPPTPTRETGGEWSETEKPPTSAPHSPPPQFSTAVVVASVPHAAAARYVPPRAASRTADTGRAGGGGWYSWNGGRTAAPAPRSRPAPPPTRQRAEEVPPPPPPPPPVPAPAQAPPPAPAPAHAHAPPPAPAPARSIDRVVPNIMSRKRRAAAMQRTALVARGAAACLCLAALAVLAADTRKGWALDSYSRYIQFRYSEAVNVIGFLYSVFQFVALAVLMRKNKHLIPHPRRDLFDFTMDQVLAYLLISSSSSATARVGDWIDNWGSDPFPNMANGSIAVSFLAFLVFAICSLISAYNLFRRDM